MNHSNIFATEDNAIQFDYTLAHVDAEATAQAETEVQQTVDHNQYYQDLLGYIVEGYGF